MNSITILGSGDTLGTPLSGCNKPSCLDKDVKSKRTRFGILIDYEGHKILIDTNPDIKWQCINSNFELKEVDTVLITHTHSDHVNGMGEFFFRRKVPTNVFSLDHPLTQKHMEYFSYLQRENVLNFKKYNNYIPFEVNSRIKVTPIELNHGFPCSGFVVELGTTRIGIVSDTKKDIPEKSLERLKGCDYLFIDSFTENYEQITQLFEDNNEPIPESIKKEWYHMTIEEALEIHKKIGSKNTYTVHMSRYMDIHSKLTTMYQTDNFIIGYDNLKVKL